MHSFKMIKKYIYENIYIYNPFREYEKSPRARKQNKK